MTRVPDPGASIEGFTEHWEFLSNFHFGLITYEGIRYRSVEHAFQATKTLDPRLRERIARLPHPRDAKRDGRALQLRPGWNDIRVRVMRDLIKIKFAPFSELAWSLVETYPARLIEANDWHDNFWGDCRCGARETCRAEGTNQLGLDLVVWRDHLVHRRRSA